MHPKLPCIRSVQHSALTALHRQDRGLYKERVARHGPVRVWSSMRTVEHSGQPGKHRERPAQCMGRAMECRALTVEHSERSGKQIMRAALVNCV